MEYNIKRLGENSTVEVELMGCERLEAVKQLIEAIDNAQDFVATVGGPEEQDLINHMTEKEMSELKAGDIVRHVSGGEGYMVTSNYGKSVTAVRTINATNPREWILVRKNGNRIKG